MENNIPFNSAFIKHRFKNLQNEKLLQAELEEFFKANDIAYKREVILDKGNIIDFMLGNVGVEVKCKATPMAIYEQLKRYAELEQIHMLILISNKAMRLPKTINNKPVYIITLGQSWL